MPVGPRTPDLVFYSLIGGVAPSLLVDANGIFKTSLSADDWNDLVGATRDAHMMESIAPRAPLAPPSVTYTLGSDPDHGREWNTTNAMGVGDLSTSVDFQFACTFDLSAPRDCTAELPCDCATGSPGAVAPDGPPLCDPNARTLQVRGKAYPSLRELRVAKGHGPMTGVQSICASWMPALAPFFSMLGAEPDGQCFPKTLQRRDDCTVSCQMIIVYVGQTDQGAGCTDPGTSQPDPSTLDWFRRRWLAQVPQGPPPVMCTYRQLASCDGTCAKSPDAGWCFVTGAENTGGCARGIAFGAGGPPSGTTLDLVCAQ